MIFLTVGTTSYPFNRLLIALDKAIQTNKISEKAVIQGGESRYHFRSKVDFYKRISFKEMKSHLKNARLIISHAGPSTLYLAHSLSKFEPLIVPRLKKYSEHADDHQLFFAKFLSAKGYSEVLLNDSSLDYWLGKMITMPQKKKKGKLFNSFYTAMLISKLTAYTNGKKFA